MYIWPARRPCRKRSRCDRLEKMVNDDRRGVPAAVCISTAVRAAKKEERENSLWLFSLEELLTQFFLRNFNAALRPPEKEEV